MACLKLLRTRFNLFYFISFVRSSLKSHLLWALGLRRSTTIDRERSVRYIISDLHIFLLECFPSKVCGGLRHYRLVKQMPRSVPIVVNFNFRAHSGILHFSGIISGPILEYYILVKLFQSPFYKVFMHILQFV